jgi:hypothetical protein
MKKNMGITDKIIRLLIAVVMMSLYFTNVITGLLGIVFIVISVVFLLTSLISFCPLYAILGISSKQKEN